MNRRFLYILLLLPIAAARPVDAQSLLPIEAYASLPRETGARLSPDGTQIASRFASNGQVFILRRKIGDPDDLVVLFRTDNRKARINWFTWANDNRVILSARYPARRSGVDTMENRLLAVDGDGTRVKNLIRPRRYVPQLQDNVIDFLPDDPDHVLISIDLEKPGAPAVYRLNVDSGKTKRIQPSIRHVRDWMTDRQHRLRLRELLEDGVYRVQVRDIESKRWNTLWEFDAYSADAVRPMGFDADPNMLYVSAYHEGRRAIFRVNLATDPLERTLVRSHPMYDVTGSLVYSELNKRVVGLRDTTQDNAYVMWDEPYIALVNGITNALPDTNNFLTSLSHDERRYILFSTSNTESGVLLYGDRDEGTLTAFANLYPALTPDRLVGKTRTYYKARDGVDIEAFLTLPDTPDDTGPLPAVILPHGGPISRVTPGFDYWTEFLASRGYAVLEMNFRGSGGYGIEFMQAGLAEWATQIHNDITDGTHFLVQEGIADPKRICIVGGSFGGYAALLGAAREPSLYRCAMAFAPVTDLQLLLRTSRRYRNEELVEAQLGTNQKRLRSASPRRMADDMIAPILLVHGEQDRRVDVNHSRQMHRALTGEARDVRYVELEDGDHHLSIEENRITTFREMEAFLRTNLNP